MADATDEFWADLRRRRHEPALAMITGSLRVDVVSDDHVEHWLLRINKGDLAVSQENVDADCIVRVDRATYNRITSGELRAFVATMRGQISIDGNPTLALLLRRLRASRREMRGSGPDGGGT